MKQARIRPQVVDDLTDLEDVSAAGALAARRKLLLPERLAGDSNSRFMCVRLERKRQTPP